MTFAANWRDWWNCQSTIRRWGPLVAVLAYWTLMYALGGLRDDVVVTAAVPLSLYYLGPKLHPILMFLLPLVLTSVIYDSMRYYADFIRADYIRVVEPYQFDLRWFGIETASGRLTPNEWWEQHTHWVLDFFTGLGYIIFIPVYLATAALFVFYYSRKGTKHCHGRSIAIRSPQIMWAFFWVNMLGYATYYIYPASPPWYAALYGFGPARLDVLANLAGCARFDQLLGINLFKEWYGRSADVHGAIPSLHVAYPFMTVYYAFRFGALRVFAVSFSALMCFAAVYLNHHYIIDVLLGLGYAAGTCFVVDMYWNWSLKRKGVIIPDVDLQEEPLTV